MGRWVAQKIKSVTLLKAFLGRCFPPKKLQCHSEQIILRNGFDYSGKLLWYLEQFSLDRFRRSALKFAFSYLN